MRWPWSSRPDMRQMFETRSHAWAQVGLASQLTQRAARRAKRQVLIFLPTLIGILIVYSHRNQVFGRGNDTPVRVVTVVALVILGWAVARDIGRALGPALFRRLDPATAGTVGFLIRLLTIGLAILIAARIAGLEAPTIAVGGA